MATISKKAAAAAELAEQCRRLYLPMPTHYGEKELVFAPPRRWRFDCAWTNLEQIMGWGTPMEPEHPIYGRQGRTAMQLAGPKLALEIDGGVFLKGGGRHNMGPGYRADCEKLNEAVILGWYVMRCLPEQIRSGQAVEWLDRFFHAHHVLLPKAPPTFHRRNYEPTKEAR